ncbi:MAG: hypothetical protein R6U52_01395 [Kosmotogaceae bacterium]
MYESIRDSYGNADVKINLGGTIKVYNGCSVKLKDSTVQIRNGKNIIITHLRNCLIVAKPMR